MSENAITYKINELNPDMIAPSTKDMYKPDQGGSKIIIAGRPGCFASGTKVLMYDGSVKNVENVKEGEQVMGDDSKPRNVLELCNNFDTMYKIIPDDGGEPVIVNENHILSLRDIYSTSSTTVDLTLKVYLEMPSSFKKENYWYRTGVEFETRNIEIDPYSTGFSGEDIPISCKINSREVRLNTLAGIIDSRGYFDSKSEIYNISHKTSAQLEDSLFIARSLGFAALKNGEYTCTISGDISNIPCKIFENIALKSKSKYTRDVLLTSFQIEKLEHGEYFGFVLDGNHRFLLADFSVVHNTGKSTLITSLMYAKKHIFPAAVVVCGSEESNGFYGQIVPSTFIYNSYSEDIIKKFAKRQKLAKEHLPNPWAILLLDDCTDDITIFNSSTQHGIWKRGRHWKAMYIVSLQYSMDIRPVIRTNVDYIFILREPILKNRKNLYENYCGIIPSYQIFSALMDNLTTDHCALVIHNSSASNNWQDCVFWYRSTLLPPGFKIGSKEYREFHDARYNEDYFESYDVI